MRREGGGRGDGDGYFCVGGVRTDNGGVGGWMGRIVRSSVQKFYAVFLFSFEG